MITNDIPEFLSNLPPLCPIIGLDLGEKTIGVAVSDTYRSVATPLETVRRKKFSVDAARLKVLIRQKMGHRDYRKGKAYREHERTR